MSNTLEKDHELMKTIAGLSDPDAIMAALRRWADERAAPPPPPSDETLQEAYDRMFNNLLETDPVVRRYKDAMGRCDLEIDSWLHRRHLQVIALREHVKKLKLDAEAALRAEFGVRKLPGLRARRETQLQFRARMKRAVTEVENQMRDGTLKP